MKNESLESVDTVHTHTHTGDLENKKIRLFYKIKKIKDLSKKCSDSKYLKKNSAVTLVALAITIIILLILAGVTLNMMLGENGLITRVQQAKERTNQSSQKEFNKLEQYLNALDNTEGILEYEKNKYKDNTVFLEHFNDRKYKFGNASAYINNTYIAYPAKEEYKLEKDFTIDYWVCETSNNVGKYNSHIVSSVAGGIWTGLYYGKYTVAITGYINLIEIEKPKENEWTHIAICRKDNVLSIYFNGELKGTVETNYVFQPGIISIGYDFYNNNFYSKNIYIDEIRILNGVCKWESNFTPPNNEVNENEGNLVFLDHLNSEPNNILSKTAYIVKNNSKFGESSIYLNNNDSIRYPAKEEYKLEKDFTIDYWVYETSNNVGKYNSHIVSSVAGGIWTGLYYGKYTVAITGYINLIEIEKPKENEWTHIAICRKDNVLSIYFNGELKGTVETNYVFQPGIISIGYDCYNNNFYSKNIYIDEIRILNGYCQWTENFTVPDRSYKY